MTTGALLLASLASLACGASEPTRSGGPVVHAVAYVTDSLSHGVLGDNLLSLEEAILLHNGQLSFNQLSPVEQSLLSLIPGTGSTTDVTWIDIDGTGTPIITVERDLSPILDTSFGLLIKGFNEPPVIDFTGPGITRGFSVPANSVNFEDLILLGGPYGVDVTQTDTSGQVGASLRRVSFRDHANFAFRVNANAPNGVGRVIVEQCDFRNVPVAIESNELGAGRTTIFEARDLLARGIGRALTIRTGPGGFGRYTFDRLDFVASVSGVELLRPAAADRVAAIEASFLRVDAPNSFHLQTSTSASTGGYLRMGDLRAPSGSKALRVGGVGHRVDLAIEDLTVHGDLELSIGGGFAPIEVNNLRVRNATVDLAASVAQPLRFALTRFDACSIRNLGSLAIAMQECCVVGGSIQGLSTAPFQLVDCFVAATTANVSSSSPRAAEQLGGMSVSPTDVGLGGTVQLRADLPSGLFGAFVIGITDPAPVLLPQPLHLYSVPSLTVAVPGLFTGRQSVGLVVANHPVLLGIDMVAHLAVVPGPGIAGPPVAVPPGARFVVR
jgi:hypothetical protein